MVVRLRASGCLYPEDEARMLVATARGPAELAAMVDRRADGVPVEHVVGWAEFCGRRILVDPGVFIPRRRTEFLVEQAARLARWTAERRRLVLDLCCGSGAVGVAVAAALRGVELHAVDIDAAAVRCATRNVRPVGGRVYQGDLYEALPPGLQGGVHVIVANPPYVPTAAIELLPREARLHEPRAALDGGADGLDVLRRVMAGAHSWLVPGGHVLVETSDRQAAQTVAVVCQQGLLATVAKSEALQATVVVGKRPPAGRRPA